MKNDNEYFVHQTAIIDDEVIIGDRTKIWHFSHIQSGATIGENCSLGQNVNVGNNVKIGNSVKIQNNVSVYTGVKCEDDVFLGPSMVFTNVMVPRSEFPKKGDKIIILGGDNYRIGMGGAAVSSADTGVFGSAIELNAVQRSNPEMQKRAANVIRAMSESDNNPIVSIKYRSSPSTK